MRHPSSLLPTGLLLAVACSNQGDTTAPSIRHDDAPVSQNLQLPVNGSPPNAKPSPAFTKVFTVEAGPFHLNKPEVILTGTATCPAGSVAVGGSWSALGAFGDSEIIGTSLNGSNGYGVTYWLNPNGIAISVSFYVTATCLQ